MAVIDARKRLMTYPFGLMVRLKDAAFEHGYRIGPEEAAGWIFFRSSTAPGEIALAALSDRGPFVLSIQHDGTARELVSRHFATATPCARGHAAALVFDDLDALFMGVSQAYRLSMSLPTFPLEQFLKETEGLGTTEAEQTVRIRKGQDIFRAALMEYWNRTCPLTGITDTALLRASHIVPWAACTSDDQRLDVHNGLLLSSLWDAAFDAGLVSFDNNGRAIASPALSDEAAVHMLLSDASPLPLSPQHLPALAWHRQYVWLS
ncbi:HNH endonuclease [Asticcacaulis sp. W401b]|uniref:HNH endonuclease n=1 Tax=Asticcacaulis sp. W401b TaxID=3388666 RepID=UPI0039704CD6